MRPTRLLCQVCIIFLVLLLALYTFLSSHITNEYGTTSSTNQQGGFRALFSFHAPSSLFPPSAIISLTDDNSTFFLSRPAAFGPSLPSDGLSGQLWVGSGFGDDSIVSGGASSRAEGELGCSDIPGWSEGDDQYDDEHRDPAVNIVKGQPGPTKHKSTSNRHQRRSDLASNNVQSSASSYKVAPRVDDGTDDYLHYPLQGIALAKGRRIGKEQDNTKTGSKAEHADIQSLQESAEIAGKVVLLSRGGCGFFEKVKWAQRRGGVAVVVGDNTRGGPLVSMYAKGDTSNVTIPSLFTSRTTAHLLSSLIPANSASKVLSSDESGKIDNQQAKAKPKKSKGKRPKNSSNGPTFTQAINSPKVTNAPRPNAAPESDSMSSSPDAPKTVPERSGWWRSLLATVGLGSKSDNSRIGMDSRRPPSSGRINWVVSEDWNDEPRSSRSGRPSVAGNGAGKAKSNTRVGPQSGTSDDFVIGVQDWRDPDLVGSKDTKSDNNRDSSSDKVKPIDPSTGNTLAGGSRAPGSGVYGAIQQGAESSNDGKASQSENTRSDDKTSNVESGWLGGIFTGQQSQEDAAAANKEAQDVYKTQIAPHFIEDHEFEDDDEEGPVEHEGLWVTMTPTSMSTSPFFDTLLVLVVSPLVTLTLVYALLLLRSRIRRRRWRAPKSVVDRLPIRTYHTMSSSSSSTSSLSPSLDGSSPTSPLLQSNPRSILTRTRPRSRTTSVLGQDSSSSLDHAATKASIARERLIFPRKKYSGKQVECVVCLEEYIDGQSRVMSLPCGHEFHAECM